MNHGPRLPWPLTILAIAMTFAGAAACSSEADNAATGTGEPPPSPVVDDPSATTEAAEGEALTNQQMRRAARALARARTGTYAATAEIPGTVITRSGQYRLDTWASTAHVEYDRIGDDDFSTDYVNSDDTYFFKFTAAGQEPRRCWLSFDYSELLDTPRGAQIPVPTDAVSGVPPEVSVLLYASVGPSGTITSDLYTTASILGGRFISALGIDPDAEDRTPITVSLDGDGGASWSSSLHTLIESARDAGATPSEELDVLSGTGSPIEASVSAVGDPVEIVVPPERLVVRPTGDDSVDRAAGEACENG